MMGAIGAGVNLVTGVVKGIVAQQAHKKYAQQLSELEMEMPTGILQSQSIREDMAFGDMPGLSSMMGDVDAGVSSTMTQAKKVADSPAALIDALIASSTSGENQKRGLGVQNAMYQDKNLNALSGFYSQVKAPAEQQIQQFDIDKTIAINKENMQATNALMQGIEGGIGSAFSAFGSGKQLDMMGKRNEAQMEYWANNPGVNPGANAGGGRGNGSDTNPFS